MENAIRRSLNFQIPLTKYLSERRGDPFIWGMTDCVMFAVDCLDIILERPIIRPALGYVDRVGAVMGQAEHPFLATIQTQTKVTRINPHLRQTGDIAYALSDDGVPSVFIIEGNQAWTAYDPEQPENIRKLSGVLPIPARALPHQQYEFYRIGTDF